MVMSVGKCSVWFARQCKIYYYKCSIFITLVNDVATIKEYNKKDQRQTTSHLQNEIQTIHCQKLVHYFFRNYTLLVKCIVSTASVCITNRLWNYTPSINVYSKGIPGCTDTIH